jgi:hypothetical protein
MLKLDKSKPYAVISPSWSGKKNEFDRPAYFQQDRAFFDKDGFQIVAGQPREPEPIAAPRESDLAPSGASRPPSDYQAITSPFMLLQRHVELPLPALRERAQVVLRSLNKPCPQSRKQIVEALLEVLGARGSCFPVPTE